MMEEQLSSQNFLNNYFLSSFLGFLLACFFGGLFVSFGLGGGPGFVPPPATTSGLAGRPSACDCSDSLSIAFSSGLALLCSSEPFIVFN